MIRKAIDISQFIKGLLLCPQRELAAQECPSVKGQLPACLKNSTENAHQISPTLLKADVWGVVDMHYFDRELSPMTLVLKLDLDMVVTNLRAKN